MNFFFGLPIGCQKVLMHLNLGLGLHGKKYCLVFKRALQETNGLVKLRHKLQNLRLLWFSYSPGGGGSFTKIVRGCACRTSKIWLSLYQFFAKFPTHQYRPTIFERKAPNLDQIGCFYNNLPKIHPIYVIWAPSFLMKTPRSLYQISRKSAPKGRHIYVYHVNVRTPPREL